MVVRVRHRRLEGFCRCQTGRGRCDGEGTSEVEEHSESESESVGNVGGAQEESKSWTWTEDPSNPSVVHPAMDPSLSLGSALIQYSHLRSIPHPYIMDKTKSRLAAFFDDDEDDGSTLPVRR